jgi:multimeric flavodoxin WrbA
MKVLLVNGSARNHGCTGAALDVVAGSLNEEGIETELVFLGNKPISDCIDCGKCMELRKCAIEDEVNEIVEKAKECDGFVFGSPVYYAHPTAKILAFMDRAFFSGGRHFAFKPAAAVLNARRAGTTASMDVMNKYFTINSMPVASSTYWNDTHGSEPEEVAEDLEGLSTMRNIGKSLAWIIKSVAIAKENGIEHPIGEKVYTNFIR